MVPGPISAMSFSSARWRLEEGALVAASQPRKKARASSVAVWNVLFRIVAASGLRLSAAATKPRYCDLYVRDVPFPVQWMKRVGFE